MLTIDSAADMERALASPIAADLRRLLTLRRRQAAGQLADTARFVIVQPGDRAAGVEAALGFSPTVDWTGRTRETPPSCPSESGGSTAPAGSSSSSC
jgi:hypothetical protein